MINRFSNQPIYTVAQIRDCEEQAMKRLNLSVDDLMEYAGKALLVFLEKRFPAIRSIAVFCGRGNNAGDGYVLARLAHEKGYSIVIHQDQAIHSLSPAAHQAARAAYDLGIPSRSFEEPIDPETELCVDALLGIGLRGEVREPLLAVINQLNESQLPILSVDLPSGLEADTGRILGSCVRATATLTFIGLKLGLLTQHGPDYCGELSLDPLDLSAEVFASITPAAYSLSHASYKGFAKPRLKNSHKGQFGHVLIIGSGHGMPGAACLAAMAALRVGTGLVTVATHPNYALQSIFNLPESLIVGIEEASELVPLIQRASVCIIGPGLGEDDWARMLFQQAMISQLPMVIDASALRLLSKSEQQDDNWVLTPHPAEAAALLHCNVDDIQADRYQAIHQIQQRYGGQIVLKGVGSLICTDTGLSYLCTVGNPGMASAGMGDVLTGVIAGLIAQGSSLAEAAKTGVLLHAMAGDSAAALGERGLLASDLMPYLHRLVNVN